MKYILLIYGDEGRWEAASQEELARVYEARKAYGDAMTAAGVLRGGAELKPTATATSVRFGGGRP